MLCILICNFQLEHNSQSKIQDSEARSKQSSLARINLLRTKVASSKLCFFVLGHPCLVRLGGLPRLSPILIRQRNPARRCSLSVKVSPVLAKPSQSLFSEACFDASMITITNIRHHVDLVITNSLKFINCIAMNQKRKDQQNILKDRSLLFTFSQLLSVGCSAAAGSTLSEAFRIAHGAAEN